MTSLGLYIAAITRVNALPREAQSDLGAEVELV